MHRAPSQARKGIPHSVYAPAACISTVFSRTYPITPPTKSHPFRSGPWPFPLPHVPSQSTPRSQPASYSLRNPKEFRRHCLAGPNYPHCGRGQFPSGRRPLVSPYQQFDPCDRCGIPVVISNNSPLVFSSSKETLGAIRGWSGSSIMFALPTTRVVRHAPRQSSKRLNSTCSQRGTICDAPPPRSHRFPSGPSVLGPCFTILNPDTLSPNAPASSLWSYRKCNSDTLGRPDATR